MNQDIWQQTQSFINAASRNIDHATLIAQHNTRSILNSKIDGSPETFHGTTPFEVIYQFDSMRVLKFKEFDRPGDSASGELVPLLMIPSLINRSYVLDLMSGSSLIAHLAQNGFPTYLLDWGTPGPQHDHLHFGFYVDELMELAAHAVRREAGCKRISLLGYCMGGTMCLLYAALHPNLVEKITLLASPVNFHDEGVLSAWASSEGFNVDQLVDTLHHMDALMLQSSFQYLRPWSNYQKYKSLFESSANPKFVDSFIKLERWLNDNVSVPGEAYREFVRKCYQENRLIEGGMELNGKNVDLKKITSPILNVMARKDHLVPIKSSAVVSSLVSGPVMDELIDAGHIGLVMGSKARVMFDTVLRFHSIV